MSIFFTADSHFFHDKIIEYCHRPWANSYDMNESMVIYWNRVVRPVDEVYHLGDFAFNSKKEERLAILKRLNGKIHLIRGNHDHSNRLEDMPFEWVKDYYEMAWNHRKIILCHYPLSSWNHDRNGSWMLHGHCHGGMDHSVQETMGMSSKILDVGVDAQEHPVTFAPISMEEIEKYMDGQPNRTREGF